MKNTFKRIFLFLMVFAAIYLFFLAALFERRASEELDKARISRGQGDFKEANRHYFQALNWYAPWGSSQTAADELMDMAIKNLERGEKTEAYYSLLRLRSGLLAARSFYVPRRDLLEKANAIIILYLAESKLSRQATQEEFNNQVMIYNNLYSLDTLPKQSWYFFVLAGFFIWVFSSIWLLTIFFSNKRAVLFKTRLKLARIPIFIFIYGYALWIFSMYVA